MQVCLCLFFSFSIRLTTTSLTHSLQLETDASSDTDSTNHSDGPTKEGTIRLYGGETASSGNVEIYHKGQWGSVCDDEWEQIDADIVCQQLGFTGGALEATHDSAFGYAKGIIWLDNVDCRGHKQRLADCSSHGWGKHDCTPAEAAGVYCKPNRVIKAAKPFNITLRKIDLKAFLLVSNFTTADEGHFKINLTGGRIESEGRVEITFTGGRQRALICADGWTLREAMVVCKELGHKYAQHALQTADLFTANDDPAYIKLSRITCNGDEDNFGDCEIIDDGNQTSINCSSDQQVAGAICTDELPDLMPDIDLIQSSLYLHDQPLFYLQCAMEENCVSTTAYEWRKQAYWYYRMRRLLRFSTKVHNVGDINFRPTTPKDQWQWHQCHMHHHSMEVFSHYDVLELGTLERVAEGHKASFCLEDSDCELGVEKVFSCKNYGDQGISPRCWDQYLHDIDCQWIDITDLKPGEYILKITINPNYLIAEKNFSNNAVVCHIYYNLIQIWARNCHYTRPSKTF